MGTFMLVAVAIAVLLGAMGVYRKAGVRSTGRLLLGILFALSASATATLLYGSFALSSKGGGVLVLFAIPVGMVAWIAGYFLFASVKHERYYDLSTEEKIRHNLAQHDKMVADLRASIAKKMAESNKFFISGSRRDRLRREIEQEREMLANLPKLRPALERPETYQGDEP